MSTLPSVSAFHDREKFNVGDTLSTSESEEKEAVIAEVKKWYGESKELSPDGRMFAFFSSPNFKDWMTAGEYFLRRKDKRAVKALLEKLPGAGVYRQGDLCELIARFGDPAAIEPIRKVMKHSSNRTDRVSAAIALWKLGDKSGLPPVIEEVSDGHYSTDAAVWFLIYTRDKEAIDALERLARELPHRQATGVVKNVASSITGDLLGRRREPAGCAEVARVLRAAMERSESIGEGIGRSGGGKSVSVEPRIKDIAANAFVVLRDGARDRFGGWPPARIDEKVFNIYEPDEKKRDAQIEKLKEWYDKNKDRLSWDEKRRRLKLTPESE